MMEEDRILNLNETGLSDRGILLLNLGTPGDSGVPSVRRYLRTFLNDSRVITLPNWLRWPLVNFILIPFRARRSAQAYQKIWEKEGSPLRIQSQRLQAELAKKIGDRYQVVLGMRYGNPSISEALDRLKTCRHLHILPLFPQYASAVTGSILEQILSTIARWQHIPNLQVKNDFYQESWFIEAYAQHIKKATEGKAMDMFLFSYHGLPERHLNKTVCLSNCHPELGCPVQGMVQHDCYRAQCYLTSQALARAVGISASQVMTAFQSRLGYTPWIQPYLDQLLPNLVRKGVKNIAVVCPSFVVDCLETLEEVGMRMKEIWKKLGGGEFVLVPCLNDEAIWVEGLARYFCTLERPISFRFPKGSGIHNVTMDGNFCR